MYFTGTDKQPFFILGFDNGVHGAAFARSLDNRKIVACLAHRQNVFLRTQIFSECYKRGFRGQAAENDYFAFAVLRLRYRRISVEVTFVFVCHQRFGSLSRHYRIETKLLGFDARTRIVKSDFDVRGVIRIKGRRGELNGYVRRFFGYSGCRLRIFGMSGGSYIGERSGYPGSALLYPREDALREVIVFEAGYKGR